MVKFACWSVSPSCKQNGKSDIGKIVKTWHKHGEDNKNEDEDKNNKQDRLFDFKYDNLKIILPSFHLSKFLSSWTNLISIENTDQKLEPLEIF